MLPFGEERGEAAGGFRNRVRPGDTDGVEAFGAGVGDQALLEGVRVKPARPRRALFLYPDIS